MKNLLYTFLLGVLMLLNKPANATHLSGGELFYNDLGNNNYKITLRIYRDCFCVQCATFSALEYINIYDVNGTLLKQESMPFPGSEILYDTTSCLNNYPTCVELAEYTATVNLSSYSDSVFKIV